LFLLLYGIIGFLVAVLSVTLYNVITAPMLYQAPRLQSTPWVSVLVPARDEEHNIGACLEGLVTQDYPKLEILVLDDGSTDRTAAIVNDFVERDRRVRLLAGEPLPSGWLGKNWACHQLSRHATGDFLIFTDADVRHASGAVTHTLAWMQSLDLGMLSAFSQQITRSLPEKLVVPVINMLVYSFLPMWLTYRSRAPLFAAANGQWIAFTRQAYERLGGHQAVRNQVVEDVELSRLAKRMGEKILVVCGNREVFCRMYDSDKALWEGFSKNVFGLIGHRTVPFFGLLIIFFLAFILPYFLVWVKPYAALAAIAIFLNFALRLFLALKYRQPVVVSTLLHPFAIAFTMLIGLNSYRWFKTGKIRWKGRRLQH